MYAFSVGKTEKVLYIHRPIAPLAGIRCLGLKMFLCSALCF
jgi:hypothetical protein